MNAPYARRNDPCPCGSGARYKDCHGKLGAAPAALGADEAFQRAMEAHRRRQPQAAIALFDVALAADPGNAFALHFKGYGLCQLGRFDEGLPLLERALAAQPRNADFHGNLGIIHYVLGDLARAIPAFERAIALAPRMAEAYSNLAMARRDAGDPERALADVRRALELNPQLPAARLNYAMILLALGRFAEAWPAYVWRPQPAANLRDLGIAATLPHATALPDLTRDPWITLHGEQGLGDALFFLRYAAALRARGARLRFWGDARLAPMLLRSAIVDDATSGGPPPGLDPARLAWIGDLPALLHLESEFPAPVRLAADPARVAAMRERLAAFGPAPYIALTWRAGLPRRGKAVLAKEIDPRALGAALAGLDATFISIQRDPLEGEREALAAALGAPVGDFSAANADLDDALALLDVVDEYAGVSNTNTHLRASLGRGAHVLVPWPPEWRWLRAGGASPWFPGFPLYRASSTGDWAPALARLRAGFQPVSR
ncbi:MAG TPA: tetratricopeptide repeat protein [Usitatibacter sp.]